MISGRVSGLLFWWLASALPVTGASDLQISLVPAPMEVLQKSFRGSAALFPSPEVAKGKSLDGRVAAILKNSGQHAIFITPQHSLKPRLFLKDGTEMDIPLRGAEGTGRLLGIEDLLEIAPGEQCVIPFRIVLDYTEDGETLIITGPFGDWYTAQVPMHSELLISVEYTIPDVLLHRTLKNLDSVHSESAAPRRSDPSLPLSMTVVERSALDKLKMAEVYVAERGEVDGGWGGWLFVHGESHGVLFHRQYGYVVPVQLKATPQGKRIEVPENTRFGGREGTLKDIDPHLKVIAASRLLLYKNKLVVLPTNGGSGHEHALTRVPGYVDLLLPSEE